MNDLTTYEPPARMTEREVRHAGAVSNRLCSLRDFLRQGIKSGSITVHTTNGTQPFTLPRAELEAVVSLLIERDTAFLIGLNIEIEQ